MKTTYTTVELNKELHEKVRDLAKRSGVKIKKVIAYAIEHGLIKFRIDFARVLGEDNERK